MQNPLSSVLESRQDSTFRLYQSMTATRSAHRDIGYIGRPYLIGALDVQVPQQVWIDLVAGMRTAGSGLWIYGFQTHDAHQPLHTFSVECCIAQSAQMISH